MGDSMIHLGHGIEDNSEFQHAIVDFFRTFGEMLQIIVGSSGDFRGLATVGNEVMERFELSLEASVGVAAACSNYLKIEGRIERSY